MAATSVERCNQKKVYLNSQEALEVLVRARLTARSPQTLIVYRCNCCRKFHLGNNQAITA